MYQPRRAGRSAAERVRVEAPQRAAGPAPRRAARRWYATAADRVGAIFVGLAVVGTAGALTLAGTAAAAPIALPVTTPDSLAREAGVSRDAARSQIAAEDALAGEAASLATRSDDAATLEPTRTMYAKKAVAVVAAPEADAKKLGSVKLAGKLTVTPQTDGEYRLVQYRGGEAWVLKASLSNSKPSAEQVADGSAPAATRSVPSGSVLGLKPVAMVVYRAVMARWDVKNVGGYRAHSLSVHQFGRAIDFMTYSNVSQGNAIAAFLIAHAKEFHVDHIIYRQRIWTPYHPSWRHMADRGSATANHMDHVHVAVDNV
ncbi:hypothetical protein [Micropruina sp.]|uniref:hypothetical protein n=1 Tax=Micropruina sp. TaxID=2737536 RepID=UPI0039E3EC72